MSIYHISLKGLISDAAGSKPLFRVIPLICLVTVIMITSIATILLYKRRMLQIKLCIAIIVLSLGLEGLIYYYINVSAHQLGSRTSYGILFVFPIVSAILTYLSIRGIAKDEALVRSADRLR